MSVIRVNKTKDYTIISNFHLKDKNLSLKAKGLLSVMLSLPEDWCYSIDGLVNICKENETAINSTLKELKVNNYLVVTKLMPNQTQTGRIEYIYDIYETPKQEVEKQDLEILGVENQGQLNTNNINTNNQEDNNKDINNTDVKKKIEKEKKSDDSIIVFNYYLNKAIELGYAKNRVDPTDTTLNNIKKYLREYSLDIIKDTINRYFEVINNKDYFFDTYWNAEKFFKQGNTFKDFLEDGNKWVNYLNWKNKPKQTYNNSNKIEKKKLTKFEEEYFANEEKRFYEGK